jgi:hydroxysqualene synthase
MTLNNVDNRAVSVDHYENFPVASLLCPPALRPSVTAIYRFARTADDIADEGDATPARRLNELAEFRADLAGVLHRGTASARWPGVFEPLRTVLQRPSFPSGLLEDLLSAFEQDVVKHDYADRAELLDYCNRSANPVGRLLLHLYGIDDAAALRHSDAICSALQLANFWQDFGVDTARGRLYTPASDRARHGVSAVDLLAGRDAPNVRRLVADLAGWARELMLSGVPLVHAIPGRAGWELRLVVQGGLRILDKIAAIDFDTLTTRPTLAWHDFPVMVWRALKMRAPRIGIAQENA